MTEKSKQKLDASAKKQRMMWVRPNLTRARAGDAENSNLTTFDNVAGNS